MAVAVMVAATLFTILTAVAGIVTTFRHVPPTTDRATGKVVARALARGTLPPHEPERDLGRRTADSRARNVWLALMPLGLSITAVLNARETDGGLPPPLWWGLAALLLLGALLNGWMVVQARRALRS